MLSVPWWMNAVDEMVVFCVQSGSHDKAVFLLMYMLFVVDINNLFSCHIFQDESVWLARWARAQCLFDSCCSS